MTDLVLLDNLAEQSPSQVMSFVESVWTVTTQEHHFNWWLGLAEVAVQKTFQNAGQINLDWAEVAIRVYTHLIELDSDKQRELMRFKARLIRELGYVDPLPLATVDETIDWFFDSLTMTLEETRDKITMTDVETMRRLRVVKNNLGVIEVIAAHPRIQAHADLQNWLEIKKALP